LGEKEYILDIYRVDRIKPIPERGRNGLDGDRGDRDDMPRFHGLVKHLEKT